MASDNQDVRSIASRSGADSRGADRVNLEGASIGELVKQLSTDSSRLVEQEIHLAKVELRESTATVAGGAGKIGAAVVLALPGVMAVTAAIAIGLGILIHSYWVSSLIVGVVVLASAGFMMKRAISAFKQGLAPKETIETVRDDVQWAKEEAKHAKHELSA